MAHAPGPQPIVAVVSDGFSTTDGKDQFADAVARALRADIAINVLDTAPSNSAGDDAILSAFARDTGGIFIHSAGDLDASLAQTATVRLPSYLLGFVPASTTPGGKFHALTVELANNPSHFTIQTRAGYFTSTPAANAAAPEKSASEKDQLTQAIFNPQPVGGVPVEFHVELARVQDDRTQVTVIIGVDLHSFRFHKDGGDNLDDLHYMVGIFDEHGNYVAGQEKTITLRLTDPQLREMTSTGATFSVILDAKPGDDQIRVALMDTGSQQLQFSSQPFNVP